MKAFKDLKEIEKACEQVRTCAAGSDGFMYRCFPFLLKQLAEINSSLTKLAARKKRVSFYNLYVAKQLRQGKTLKEAVTSWKDLKDELA